MSPGPINIKTSESQFKTLKCTRAYTIIKMQPSITCDGKMVVFLLFQLTNVLFPISNVLSLTTQSILELDTEAALTRKIRLQTSDVPRCSARPTTGARYLQHRPHCREPAGLDHGGRRGLVREEPLVPQVLVRGRLADPHRVLRPQVHRGHQLRGDHQDAHQRARPREEEVTDPGVRGLLWFCWSTAHCTEVGTNLNFLHSHSSNLTFLVAKVTLELQMSV